MRWLRWQTGRQGTGYKKMLLLTSMYPFPFDVYLLKFEEGTFVDWHNDPVPEGKKHLRCNFFLKKAELGGEFEAEQPSLVNKSWVQVFRPDINKHRVTKILKGSRLVLSIGWLWSK